MLSSSVRFEGETDVVDEGGVTRELFNLGACRAVSCHDAVSLLLLQPPPHWLHAAGDV